jgi:NAD(P)H-nitrite reductase large subunit
MTKVVIIGASAAGHTAAVSLREKNRDCSISLITEEAFPFYDRRKLLDYLAGRIKEKELLLSSSEFYAQKNINFLKEKKVSGINPNRRLVYLKEEDSRESLEYDFLVICSGRKTVLPQIPGINKDGVFRLDALKNFKDCRQYLISDSVCLMGWNGLTPSVFKIMTGKQMEIKLIINEKPADYQPPEGIEVINSEVVEIIGESRVQAVKLKEGKIIGTSLVMVMDFPKASIDFLKDTDIEISQDAICVDERMCTSLKNVFSSGSVCSRKDSPVRLKSWDETVNESIGLVDNLVNIIGG